VHVFDLEKFLKVWFFIMCCHWLSHNKFAYFIKTKKLYSYSWLSHNKFAYFIKTKKLYSYDVINIFLRACFSSDTVLTVTLREERHREGLAIMDI
jgi:hypothetical protein